MSSSDRMRSGGCDKQRRWAMIGNGERWRWEAAFSKSIASIPQTYRVHAHESGASAGRFSQSWTEGRRGRDIDRRRCGDTSGCLEIGVGLATEDFVGSRNGGVGRSEEAHFTESKRQGKWMDSKNAKKEQDLIRHEGAEDTKNEEQAYFGVAKPSAKTRSYRSARSEIVPCSRQFGLLSAAKDPSDEWRESQKSAVQICFARTRSGGNTTELSGPSREGLVLSKEKGSSFF